MAMPKRLTAPRKLISIHDPALDDLPSDALTRYVTSLDIEELGDIATMPTPPTVFTVLPLRARLARVDHGVQNNNDDWWVIFAFHVTAVDNIDGALTFEGAGSDRHLHDDCRELFPDRWIRDIAGMISKLGNGDAPFLPPVQMSEIISTRKILRARLQEIAARSAAAQFSGSG